MGANVDDAAAPALVHFPGDSLADKKQAFQIGVHNAVIGLFLHIQQTLPPVDACHIKEDVDLAEPADNLVYAGLDALHVGHVQTEGVGRPATGPDVLRHCLAGFQCPAAESHLAPSLGQAPADGGADAPCGAGDENGFPLQTKERLQIVLFHDDSFLFVPRLEVPGAAAEGGSPCGEVGR